ncbi:MAG: NAD(P)-dependent oxidoreductase [Phycisphaerales bacterium]|nr:NAD(P)-dependent oxidoreductase [Phycisphaerales bacterium]
MHVALTGASGFIGSAIARDLHTAGHTCAALVRASSRRDHIEPQIDRFVEGDLADKKAWADLLHGADCVVHCGVDWAPLKSSDLDAHLERNLLGSIRLLQWSAPRQFIFISTIAVHHDMRPRWGGVIDEDHPLRPGSWYGAYKAAVEAHLWAAHFSAGQHTCALRPCGVYGLDPNLERTYGIGMLRRLRRGQSVDKPGGGKFVHVDDVAAATVACVGNPDAAGKAYNLVDCYARWADWALIAADLLGIEATVDASSPAEPKNTFTKDAARSLGVRLDRGHDGIRDYLRELIAATEHSAGS